MELNKNGRNFLLGTLFKSYRDTAAVSFFDYLGLYGCDGRCSFSDIL